MTFSGPGIPGMSYVIVCEDKAPHSTTTTSSVGWTDMASSYGHTHCKGNTCLLPVTCHSMSTCQGYLLSHVTLCPPVKAIYCHMSLYVHLSRLFTVTCHSMSTCQGYLLPHVTLCPPVKAIYCHMSLYVHLSRLFTVTRHSMSTCQGYLLSHVTRYTVHTCPCCHTPTSTRPSVSTYCP